MKLYRVLPCAALSLLALTMRASLAPAAIIEVRTDATWLTTDTAPAAGWNSDPIFVTTGWVDAFKSPSGNDIWYGSNLSSKSPNNAWFRKLFILNAPVADAAADLYFDDNGQAYLNGHELVNDTGGGATHFPDVAIDPTWFNIGVNVLAIHGIDTIAPYSNVAADVHINAIPEPFSLGLLAFGGLSVSRRRRPRPRKMDV